METDTYTSRAVAGRGELEGLTERCDRANNRQYNGYDESVKLQALQAALVYGMLCAQCTESVSVEDSAWVVGTIEVPYSLSYFIFFDLNLHICTDICRRAIRSWHMDIECGSAMSLAQPLGICRESEKVRTDCLNTPWWFRMIPNCS